MADTYTDEFSILEQNIADKSKAVSSGQSSLPQVTDALRRSLYDREKVLPGLEKESQDKMVELFRADQDMYGRYGNKQSEMFIEDPMARQAAVSGQKAQLRQEYGDLFGMIQDRSKTLGNALDKGVQLYQAGLAAQEAELTLAEKSWERAYKKRQLKMDEDKAKMSREEFDIRKKSGTFGTQAEQKTMAINNLKGEVASWKELVPLLQKYSGVGGLTPDDILTIYNQFHAQPGDAWGPAKETVDELSTLGISPDVYTRQKETSKSKSAKEMQSVVDKTYAAYQKRILEIENDVDSRKINKKDAEARKLEASNALKLEAKKLDLVYPGAEAYFWKRVYGQEKPPEALTKPSVEGEGAARSGGAIEAIGKMIPGWFKEAPIETMAYKAGGPSAQKTAKQVGDVVRRPPKDVAIDTLFGTPVAQPESKTVPSSPALPASSTIDTMSSDTQTRATQAQEAIDTAQSRGQNRSEVYARIITSEPDLIPFLVP